MLKLMSAEQAYATINAISHLSKDEFSMLKTLRFGDISKIQRKRQNKSLPRFRK